MNLVKNQKFIGQLGENQTINILPEWFKSLAIKIQIRLSQFEVYTIILWKHQLLLDFGGESF